MLIAQINCDRFCNAAGDNFMTEDSVHWPIIQRMAVTFVSGLLKTIFQSHHKQHNHLWWLKGAGVHGVQQL